MKCSISTVFWAGHPCKKISYRYFRNTYRMFEKALKKRNKPLADFRPVQQFLLVFLDATGRGRLGFTFLSSFGFERMGTRSGPQYTQLPSFRPKSSVSYQAQISHLVVHSMRHAGQCGLTLSHSVSGCGQLKSPLGWASCCWRVPYKAASRHS